MRLFTVGPVEMYDRTLKVRNKQIPYFRNEEFSEVMFQIERKLKKIVYTQESSKCVFITGSGSAAMESVVTSCFDEKSHVLVINGGVFGNRFSNICKYYNISYDEILLKKNEQLTKSHFLKFKNIKFTDLLVNIHETSTGQLYDINILKDFCMKNKVFLIVDAISSFLCDEIKMDEKGIDCLILSSQKALALSPGLSMITINNKFYEKIKNIKSKSMYLSLQEHLLNMQRGQTPNTPAVGICYELLDMLNYIEEIGIENIIKNTKKMAFKFREDCLNLGINLPKYPLSNALTPLLFDNNAYDIYEYLKSKYDFHVTPSGVDLKNEMIRVSHMGNMKQEYLDELIEKIKEVI